MEAHIVFKDTLKKEFIKSFNTNGLIKTYMNVLNLFYIKFLINERFSNI